MFDCEVNSSLYHIKRTKLDEISDLIDDITDHVDRTDQRLLSETRTHKKL